MTQQLVRVGDAVVGVLVAFEASVEAPLADATIPTADRTSPTVDALNAGDVAAFVGSVAAAGSLAATEAADIAEFTGEAVGEIAPPISGGGWPRPPRPYPIEGYGYGILPQLVGEAHGVVIAAGNAAALRVLAGDAAGMLGRLGAAGTGTAIARGQAAGVIGNIKGAATGRQDDDEAVVVWLLAA
jgi:hypothetical protein